MDNLIVAKFGGSSLADAAQVRKVIDIVKGDPRRKVVVVSAPGKRFAGDSKMTDLLIANQVMLARERFAQIATALGIDVDTSDLCQMSGDLLVSSGEYYMGKILAKALDYTFVGASLLVRFKTGGILDMPATKVSCEQFRDLAKRGIVVPGFYGALPDGSVKIFSRGGSDITGSILAAILKASIYENWTDVSGVLMADPGVVENPRRIKTMTYREMRELAYAGAHVLHDEAVYPVRKAEIPINVRNTNDPADAGTWIVADEQLEESTSTAITGIAGRNNFSVIALEKAGMNAEVGFVWKLLDVLKKHCVRFEHMPSSIDSLSLVVDERELEGKLSFLEQDIRAACRPDLLEIERGLALVCVVGQSMAHKPGVLAKLAGALAKAGVNIHMIDQGSSEVSIIVGVENNDYEKAVRAIYKAFA
ncbi:MAG: aspartate kinase [Patescibacteria group bacterium]|nr:aspartate kinase [Patescibacteria group bacterium]